MQTSWSYLTEAALRGVGHLPDVRRRSGESAKKSGPRKAIVVILHSAS
jgi:hypothetical protein